MKLAGLIMLFVSSVTLGNYAASRFDKRISSLKSFISFIYLTESSIAYCDDPVAVIFEKAKLDGNIAVLPFLSDVGGETVDLTAVKNSRSKTALNEGDCTLIASFFSSLGTTDREGQLEMCGYYKKQFEQLLDSALSKRNEQVRLMRFGGAAIGIFIFILLV